VAEGSDEARSDHCPPKRRTMRFIAIDAWLWEPRIAWWTGLKITRGRTRVTMPASWESGKKKPAAPTVAPQARSPPPTASSAGLWKTFQDPLRCVALVERSVQWENLTL